MAYDLKIRRPNTGLDGLQLVQRIAMVAVTSWQEAHPKEHGYPWDLDSGNTWHAVLRDDEITIAYKYGGCRAGKMERLGRVILWLLERDNIPRGNRDSYSFSYLVNPRDTTRDSNHLGYLIRRLSYMLIGDGCFLPHDLTVDRWCLGHERSGWILDFDPEKNEFTLTCETLQHEIEVDIMHHLRATIIWRLGLSTYNT